MSTDSSTDRTNVYAFINGGTPLENLWVAIAEDGDVLAVGYVLDPELAAIFGAGEAADGPTHVGPTGPGRDRYIEKFGDDPESAINYVVVPDGELPPEVVLERNHAQTDPELVQMADVFNATVVGQDDSQAA